MAVSHSSAAVPIESERPLNPSVQALDFSQEWFPLLGPMLERKHMHVLVIGGAGMVGRKLADRLAQDGHLGGREITRLTLHDVVAPQVPAGAPFKVGMLTSDFTEADEAERLVAERPDVIFHLAAIVSGEAEADFDKGYRINLDGTHSLFEAVRKVGDDYRPRLVFTSSIAVFGAPFPEAIGDEFFLTPLTSYGTQKAVGELLLADYTRRGLFDGVGIRLPTICVRPGKPNKAASSFFSGIIREPLNGEEAVLPVPDDVRHAHASPRSAVNFLIHAATIDGAQLGARRNLTMPSVSVTVAEQIEALRRVAGERVAARIRRVDDPTIMRIVEGWPQRFDAQRARSLGFRAEDSFDEIIRIHIEDELGGKFTP
jgi:nucleoside-diphosphate-sugar epimerase